MAESLWSTTGSSLEETAPTDRRIPRGLARSASRWPAVLWENPLALTELAVGFQSGLCSNGVARYSTCRERDMEIYIGAIGAVSCSRLWRPRPD